MKTNWPAIALALALAGNVQAQSNDNAAPPAENPPFDILEYRVLGNTVLEARDIEAAVYPFLGPNGTLESVEQARKALEETYRAKGYPSVFVDIPQQDVANGIVRLSVTEARLERVRATGAKYFSQRDVLKAVPAAKPGEVLFLPDLRAQLDEVNRGARDRVVTPVLRAGARPGTVDLDLRVKDQLPFHPSVEVNDRYTPNTSKTRVALSLSYDNVGQRGDSASVSFQTAPEDPDDTSILTLNYTARLGTDHLLALYALDSDSDIAAVGTLGVLGKGRVYGFRDIRILPAGPDASHNLSCGADYKDYADTITVEPDEDSSSGDEIVTLDSGISYANFNCQYSRAVINSLFGGEWRWSLGSAFGIRGIGSDVSEFSTKRFKGRPNYIALDLSASHSFPLPGGLALLVSSEGQYSAEPLINNEQFAIGGMESVRGYAESQQLGDYGYRVTGEIQSGRLGEAFWRRLGLDSFQLVGFADFGRVFIQEPLPDQQSAFTLFGAGAGLRLARKGLSAQIFWAEALDDNGAIEAGDARWHFLMRMGW